MRKSMFLSLLALLLFIGTDCKKENPPVVPPDEGTDTTSHTFSWTTYTFGGNAGSSYFKDVAIINDSDIWAVGAIYTDSGMYNAVHWDGKKWNLIKIQFYTFCGQSTTGVYPIEAIVPIAQNEIWFASNSEIGILINDIQTKIICLPVSVNKLWCRNSNAVYSVGAIGQIGFYNGVNWTKMESGTTIDLRDVWGSPDGKTVWACGYSNDNDKSILLQFNGSSWKTIWFREGIQESLPFGYFTTSLWSDNAVFVAAGRSVFQINVDKDTLQMTTLPWFPTLIRGSKENNIAVVGDEGMLWHYNGAGWKKLYEQSNQPFYSVAVSDNIIICVGSINTSIASGGLVYFGIHNDQ